VNAYYSCFLYSQVTGDLGRMAFTQLALTMEIQAVKYYWHMPNGSTIYDPIFTANTMAGNIGALSITASTWFGDNPVIRFYLYLLHYNLFSEPLFGINMNSFRNMFMELTLFR
jgi:endoglucanase Acf2